MRLQHPEMLLWLWAVPALLAVYAYAGWRRRRDLERFAATGMLDLLGGAVSVARRRWRAGLMLAAFALLAFSLARPAWNPRSKVLRRRGRDVVFVLDVSRSMLADDLKPNRLQRAKIAILDCVERLRGDRVGLVVFAGTAVVKCPLTLDYGFFRLMLEDVSTRSVSRGGTMIGDAMRKVLDEVFDDRAKQYKDVILITDGEDHDSFPVEAAAAAGKRGVRLIAIGIGDERRGRRIPVSDAQGRRSFLKYQGKEVWTRLDAATLRKMVNATPGGRYLNVATGTIDLGAVYLKLVARERKKELQSKTIKRYEEKFQVFLGLALALLTVQMLMSERRRGA